MELKKIIGLVAIVFALFLTLIVSIFLVGLPVPTINPYAGQPCESTIVFGAYGTMLRMYDPSSLEVFRQGIYSIERSGIPYQGPQKVAFRKGEKVEKKCIAARELNGFDISKIRICVDDSLRERGFFSGTTGCKTSELSEGNTEFVASNNERTSAFVVVCGEKGAYTIQLSADRKGAGECVIPSTQ